MQKKGSSQGAALDSNVGANLRQNYNENAVLTTDAKPAQNLDDARLHLALLAKLGQIHICTIDLSGNVAGQCFGTDGKAALDYCAEWNVKGHNVYFTANRVRGGINKKPSKDDIPAARFNFVDIDPPKDGSAWDKAAKLEELQDHAIPPSLVIDSGNGLQAFWELSDESGNLDASEAINKGIAKKFGGDHCHNIDRLMRVPGFVNWPDSKKQAKGRVAVAAKWAVKPTSLVYEAHELALNFPNSSAEDQSTERADIAPLNAEFTSLEALGLLTGSPAYETVMNPEGEDRSAETVTAARWLAMAELSNDEIAGVLLNPDLPISGHCLDQPDPKRAAGRAIALVREDVPELPKMDIDYDLIVANVKKRTANDNGNSLDWPMLDLAQLAKETPPQALQAIEGFIPFGELSLLTGPGGSGKSLCAKQICLATTAHTNFLGLKVIGGNALYLTCEDDEGELHRRLHKLHSALNVDMSGSAGKLHVVSLRGRLDNHLCTFDQQGTLKPTESFAVLIKVIESTKAKLVVLDNVAHLFSGNENDRSHVTQFCNLLNKVCGETGCTIILIAHPNKGGDNYSGSTAWLNAVRSHLTLDNPTEGGDNWEPDARRLSISKANYTRKGTSLDFQWHDWAFMLEEEMSSTVMRDLKRTAQATADNECFLKCLDERIKQKRAVSERRSATFAPTVFAKMPESSKIGKSRLEAAMDRLFRTGTIERAELWKSDDRKHVFGLRRVAGNGAPTLCADAHD